MRFPHSLFLIFMVRANIYIFQLSRASHFGVCNAPPREVSQCHPREGIRVNTLKPRARSLIGSCPSRSRFQHNFLLSFPACNYLTSKVGELSAGKKTWARHIHGGWSFFSRLLMRQVHIWETRLTPGIVQYRLWPRRTAHQTYFPG